MEPTFSSSSSRPDRDHYLPAGLQEGLSLLLQAQEYAQQVHCDIWEFAVELPCLCAAGLTLSAIRWLVGKAYLEHAVEQTPPGATKRVFRPVSSLTLPEGSCFVLTTKGVEIAQKIIRKGLPEPVARPARASDPCLSVVNTGLVRPQWRPDERELWCGPLLVKEFRRPAPHQELVLASFEEEQWPRQIDDPLPGALEVDPKRRLHDTIIRLNRHQVNKLLVFRGDGSGTAIRWCLRSELRHVPAPVEHQIDS